MDKGLDRRERDGAELESHCRRTLQTLGQQKGMLGVIFRKSQNRIQGPAKLRRLVLMIDEETWLGLDVDVKGEIYEGLLQRNAEDIKSGAGQYFTPRPLIQAVGVKANVLFFDRKPAREQPWTDKLWIYDLRTNQHFALKTNPLRDEHLQDFIRCYNPANRHEREETECFRPFAYDELLQRDKVSLDLFWLRDESLEDTDNGRVPRLRGTTRISCAFPVG